MAKPSSESALSKTKTDREQIRPHAYSSFPYSTYSLLQAVFGGLTPSNSK